MNGIKNKILIIGVDGGDWKFIEKLVKNGNLPNIESIMKNGSRAILKSTFPPITPIAWTSIVTGLNPGKHGIFAWDRYENNKRIPVTTKDIKGIKLWNCFNYFHRKVIINGVPLSYPPEEVDGCIISGWDAPYGNNDFISPENIKNYIIEKFGKVNARLFRKNYKNFSQYKKDFFNWEEKRAKITLELMSKLDWDMVFHVFYYTDHFNHEHIGGSVNDVVDAYIHMDKIIGTFLRKADNCTKLIISDHGIKRYRKIFYINQYLIEEKYLKVKQFFSSNDIKSGVLEYLNEKKLSAIIIKFLSEIITRMWRLLPLKVKKKLTKKIINKFNLLFKAIDFNSTVFYSRSRYGEIYINKKDEYIREKKHLIKSLYKLKDPVTGEKLIEKIYDLKRLYKGEFLRDAPDLYIKFKRDDIQSYPDIELEEINKNYLKIFDKEIGGDHSEDGIFLIQGNGIKKNKHIGMLNVVDIFPIVNFVCRIPIPQNIDGILPEEIFECGYLEINKPAYIKNIEFTKSGKEISLEEKEQIKSRLKDLGYI